MSVTVLAHIIYFAQWFSGLHLKEAVSWTPCHQIVEGL